jgi:hypothetical protein
MATDKTADAIKLNLRLPKALHKQLKQQARRNNVSLNTEIVNQLQGYEAATAKRILETAEPFMEQSMRSATTGAMMGAIAILNNFVGAFLAAGEGQPPTEEDRRLSDRWNKALRAAMDKKALFEVGRELDASFSESWPPASGAPEKK